MAWINRNERKRNTVKKYAALRAELKAKKDYAGLAQLPRDASPTRVVNRCRSDGPPPRLHSTVQGLAAHLSRARVPGSDPWRDQIQLVELL